MNLQRQAVKRHNRELAIRVAIAQQTIERVLRAHGVTWRQIEKRIHRDYGGRWSNIHKAIDDIGLSLDKFS